MGAQHLTWRVVGGVDKGGILVRTGREFNSSQAPERLATGAIVVQLELAGERLRFERVTGTGPAEGWVSIRIQGKDLLVPDGDAELPPTAEALPESMPLAPPAGNQEVRICSWNLLAPCYFRDPSGQKEVQTKFWQPRVELQLAAIFQMTNPDVLCLQELWFAPTVLKILASVAADRGYEVVLCRRTDQKMDGLAILVRREKLELLATEDIEICSMGNRVLLWASLRMAATGANVVVGTTHFTFPHGDQEDDQRFRQGVRSNASCQEFLRKQGLDPKSTVQLLAGDLNCEFGPADDEVLSNLFQAGWRSGYQEAMGSEAAATHRTHRGNHTCADFILVHGSGARAVSAELLPASASDKEAMPRPQVGKANGLTVPRTLEGWAQLSDHRPLVVTLSLREA